LSYYGLKDRGWIPGKRNNSYLIQRKQIHSASTHSPTELVPRILSPVNKRPKREADHLLPSSHEVKIVWKFTPFPLMS